mmetsp:Transcript_111010/g.314165  ORF Transcript_111010/g.314165 Transcript_111010/m.314165 type:complete len:243 (+) Transcript_111010:252-980(+)
MVSKASSPILCGWAVAGPRIFSTEAGTPSPAFMYSDQMLFMPHLFNVFWLKRPQKQSLIGIFVSQSCSFSFTCFSASPVTSSKQLVFSSSGCLSFVVSNQMSEFMSVAKMVGAGLCPWMNAFRTSSSSWWRRSSFSGPLLRCVVMTRTGPAVPVAGLGCNSTMSAAASALELLPISDISTLFASKLLFFQKMATPWSSGSFSGFSLNSFPPQSSFSANFRAFEFTLGANATPLPANFWSSVA